MKTTLLLKRIDLIAQLLALPVAAVYTGLTIHSYYTKITLGGFLSSMAWQAYLFLAALQMVRCVVNRILLRRNYRSKARKFYELLLVVIAIYFVDFIVLDDSHSDFALGLYSVMMLIGLVVLAIPPLYLWTSYNEIQLIKETTDEDDIVVEKD